MRALFFIPPRDAFDRNIYYRFTLFGEHVDHVRRRLDGVVEVLDGTVHALPRQEFVRRMVMNHYDALVVWAEQVADAPAAAEYASLARLLSPGIRTIVFGDAPLYVPQFFREHAFDAIYRHGDACVGLLPAIAENEKPELLPNFDTRVADRYEYSTVPAYAPPADWGYPPLDLLPLDDYRRFVRNRFDETTTLMVEDIVSFTLARGCGFGCAYCPVPISGGAQDRRRPLDDALAWLDEHGRNHAMVHFMSPIFSGDAEWTSAFLEGLIARQNPIRWKTSVRPDQISERFLSLCATAGCDSLSFGVETLSAKGAHRGPKTTASHLRELAKAFRGQGIRGKGYVMIGMPNQTREDIFYTIDLLTSLGFQVRPTGYTPHHLLAELPADQLELQDLLSFDRKRHYSASCGLTPREFYRLLERDF